MNLPDLLIDAANGAVFRGKLQAPSGTIGGWDINESTLTRNCQDDEVAKGVWTLDDMITLSHTHDNNSTYLDFGWIFGSRLDSSTGITEVYPIYGISTNSNLEFGVGSGRKGELSGTWTVTGTWTEENDTSDERVKNTIESLPETYEALFDNLQPKRYKYNHGTSDRFHTGYIAQDVVSAIEAAGLTTQDFAGVMLTEPNTENERWYLRRDEFVSLNTWQIQKAKARISELESKVAFLESQISALTNN